MHVDYTCNKEYLKGKNRTVTRTKRKVNPVVATISALALSTVILLSTATKSNTESFEIADDPSISYAQNIEDDINREFNTPAIEVIEDEPIEMETQAIEPTEECSPLS